MICTIGKQFRFEAAHSIPNHPGKCKNPHGHSYMLEVQVTGEIGNETGMVMDFEDLTNYVWGKVIGIVDHKDLNVVFNNRCITTAENLVWEFIKLLTPDKGFFRKYDFTVRLWETNTSYAEATYSPSL